MEKLKYLFSKKTNLVGMAAIAYGVYTGNEVLITTGLGLLTGRHTLEKIDKKVIETLLNSQKKG